jgi:hypothetical protein
VAGLAALLLDADPSLTPAEVRQLIRDGAIDLGAPGFDPGYGHGRIDAISSLSLLGPACSGPADCDDGDDCTTDECVDGTCTNTIIDCDDGNECTTDGCVNGSCTNAPIDCDDDDECTTDECVGGTCTNAPIDCDDGNECTIDGCVSGSCTNTPVACDDGLFCNGAEICDVVTGCISSGDPCTGTETCNESADTCDASICDGDGTCEFGEDCDNCPSDCISGQGGTCGACFKGVCNGDCHPQKEGPDCADCAPAYCCGDGFCDPGEDPCNCPADCGEPQASEIDCSNGIDDDCNDSIDCNDSACDADPLCSCGAKKTPCVQDSDCCSNRCSNRQVCL